LYKYDVLRADRSTAEHGLEVRTPFLDDDFITLILSGKNLIKSNTPKTKQLIRDVVENVSVLPDFILHGRKEAFSDAVGFCWKDSIEEYCKASIEDYCKASLENNCEKKLTPSTSAETTYYQTIFYNKFGDMSQCRELWLPNQEWVNTGTEPSARALPSY
jgi:asparagine synthase (glutamine-hydrolysing)